MAIYHFSVKPLGRGQGRNSVNAAAYRAGEKLYDARLDKTFDYTHKLDVIYKEILLPDGAPSWMSDREKLWNYVESIEKRKDSQLARDVNFALPRELTQSQNIALAREFVQTHFVAQGMVADLCLHEHLGSDGELQPHAHVLLSLRHVTEEGFGLKAREWNEKAYLEGWREAWCEIANTHLALHGHNVRIDHRTLEAQGIDLEPQHKIGPAASRVEMTRQEDHDRIARENGDKLLAHPEIALNAITLEKSTFTHHDIAKMVNRHTVDAEQFQAVYDKVMSSEELISVGHDIHGQARLSTKSHVALEDKMMTDAVLLYARDKRPAKLETLEKVTQKYTLTEQQTEALHYMTKDSGGMACVMGVAGSGKSHLLGAVREVYESAGYRVSGVALSGIVAVGLKEGAGIESRTVASRFLRWDQGRDKLTSKDVLVVDEVGMLGSRSVGRILSEVETSGAKVIMVGDLPQLLAIEAGGAARVITDEVGYFDLTEVRRQREDWQKSATLDFRAGNVVSALRAYEREGMMHDFETQAEAMEALTSRWNSMRLATPAESQIILAYTRAEIYDLNQMARDFRKKNHELGKEQVIMTERGKRSFAENDRLYFLRNEKALQVMNGHLGTVREITKGDRLIIELDHSKRVIKVDTHLYNEIDHGYAATLHKVQGVTGDNSHILSSKYFDCRGTYVGMTRHRESAHFYWSREVFANERDLFRNLSRRTEKDTTLDYFQQEKKVFVDLGRSKGVEKEPLQEKSSFTSKEDFENFLSAYQADFRARNPQKAYEVEAKLVQGFDKAALQMEYRWKEVNEMVKHFSKSSDKEGYLHSFDKYTREFSRSHESMAALEKRNPALFEVVRERVFSLENAEKLHDSREFSQKQVQTQKIQDVQKSIEPKSKGDFEHEL